MMAIENDNQLKTALDFLCFMRSHYRASAEMVALREENEYLKQKINDLEREVRVSRDLLTIAGSLRSKC